MRRFLLGVLVALATFVAFDPLAPPLRAPPVGSEADERVFSDEARLRTAIEDWKDISADRWGLGRDVKTEEWALRRLRDEYTRRYGPPP